MALSKQLLDNKSVLHGCLQKLPHASEVAFQTTGCGMLCKLSRSCVQILSVIRVATNPMCSIVLIRMRVLVSSEARVSNIGCSLVFLSQA